MGRNSYLGGNSVWDWRQSAPERYAEPDWQSRISARLLGHSDPLIQKLGKRLYDLESSIHNKLEHIERLRSPSFADLCLRAYESVRPGHSLDAAEKETLLEGFRRSASGDQEALLKEVIDLNNECSRIRGWAENLEANRLEIERYLSQLR